MSASDAGASAADASALDAGEPALDATEPSTDASAPEAGSSRDASSSFDANTPVPCQVDSPTSASGVRIHVEGDRCNVPYGQGATFRYRVTVDRPISYRVAAGTSCGATLGSDVKLLTRARVVATGDAGLASYCADCDRGCFPPNREGSYELGAQTYEGTLDWPGRTFNGPSDTGQTPGDFFPRGPANVQISVTLPDTADPIAMATLPIAIE